MIEVEIRGPLTKTEAAALKTTLLKHGRLVATKDREMILLLDGYPGEDRDPTKRTTDIRLKRTNGHCEIVVKQKLSDGNVGRREINLPLATGDLEVAKQVAAAFGAQSGIWMQRTLEVFDTPDGIEWVVGRAPHRSGSPVRYFFEAELEVDDESQIEAARKKLVSAARSFTLDPITEDAKMRDFLYGLDADVNDEFELTI